jgi:hypothetical protein
MPKQNSNIRYCCDNSRDTEQEMSYICLRRARLELLGPLALSSKDCLSLCLFLQVSVRIVVRTHHDNIVQNIPISLFIISSPTVSNLEY